jgi:hypothetical protein
MDEFCCSDLLSVKHHMHEAGRTFELVQPHHHFDAPADFPTSQPVPESELEAGRAWAASVAAE